jgi:hypothetical protein
LDTFAAADLGRILSGNAGNNASAGFNLVCWMLAGGRFYCIYRQFKPVGFGDKFKRGYAQELCRGFFIDEEPVGILPAEPSSTA